MEWCLRCLSLSFLATCASWFTLNFVLLHPLSCFSVNDVGACSGIEHHIQLTTPQPWLVLVHLQGISSWIWSSVPSQWSKSFDACLRVIELLSLVLVLYQFPPDGAIMHVSFACYIFFDLCRVQIIERCQPWLPLTAQASFGLCISCRF